MTAKDLKLDYFKVYDVDNTPLSEKVALQGQFDKLAERAQLLFLNHFANPVSKNGEPFFNKNGHLTWYAIHQEFTEPTREITVDNQFALKQRLLIGRALFLLAPAWKIEKGSVPPKGLDHFKVYQVLEGPSVNKTVNLQDQFGPEDARVGHPLLFATPVKKLHGPTTVPISNRKAHLLIYGISPTTNQRTVEARDQFMKKKFHVLRSTWLAAPSLKTSWKQL